MPCLSSIFSLLLSLSFISPYLLCFFVFHFFLLIMQIDSFPFFFFFREIIIILIVYSNYIVGVNHQVIYLTFVYFVFALRTSSTAFLNFRLVLRFSYASTRSSHRRHYVPPSPSFITFPIRCWRHLP